MGVTFYMANNETIVNPNEKKSPNKFWNVFSSVLKSLIILFIIGFIMLCISSLGSEIYVKNSFNRVYIGRMDL